jgi:ribonuclease HII
VAWGVGIVPANEIDRAGIVPSTRAAMEAALHSLCVPPDCLILDAITLPGIPLPQRAIIKGDLYCLSVAAASILAKVTRDRIMIALDQELPGYGFARHKGYGTQIHRDALCCLGTTSCHRHSFAPIRALNNGHTPDEDEAAEDGTPSEVAND